MVRSFGNSICFILTVTFFLDLGTALPKKNKPKTPATEKTVTKTKRKASKRGTYYKNNFIS